jgi:flagellar hook-associated protein 2
MATSISGTALSGLQSNIDTSVFVQAEMATEQARLGRLQAQKSGYQSKLSALDDISGPMKDLMELVEKMRSIQDVSHVSADSSDSTVVRAVATAGATEGSHDILINQLARAAKMIQGGVTPTETWTHSQGVVSADAAYFTADQISGASGDNYKFVFQFGTEAQVAVDLSAYDATGITLNQLVSEINAAAGYSAASAVVDGASYKLRLAAQNAGSGHDLAITGDHSVALLDATADFVQTADGGTGSDAVVGAGQFVYTYNGVTRTITTGAGTNLGQLRDLINNDGGNPGVSASILDYQGATGGRHHLVLTGKSTGGDYGVTVEAGTTVAGFGAAGWTETQAAQNAQIRVDGYPAGDWIETAGNVVTDVLPGVALTLYKANAASGATGITLSRSVNELKTDLQNLVNIYTGIDKRIVKHAGYDAKTDTAGVLIGDSSLNLLEGSIRKALTTTPPGFDPGQDAFTLASQIGITIDRYGAMTLDTAVLDDAIAEDYDAVLKLVGAMGMGATGSNFVQFNSSGEATTAGTYDLKVEYDAAGTITAAYFRTAGEGDDDWRSATVDGSTIIGATGKPEQWLQVTASADPAHLGEAYTLTTEVRAVRGLGGALYDVMNGILDETTGAVAVKRQRYDDAMSQLDTRIQREQDVLAQKEAAIKAKYARMEATLAQLDSFRASYESLFSSLDSQKSDNS